MANDLVQMLVLFGIPTVILVLFALSLVFIIALFFHFRSKRKIDSLKVLFSEMVELAKVNYDPNMLALYRLDVLPPGKYIRTADKALTLLSAKRKPKDTTFPDQQLKHWKEFKSILSEYADQLRYNARGIYKGEIVGFNRVNLYSSFEEIYHANEVDGSYSMSLEEKVISISGDEHDRVTNVLKECGGFLNVIVYETFSGWKIPGLWRNKLTKAILCFDDQLRDYNSDDGCLTVLAPGTESHGFYFEIPSGSQDRTKVILSVIRSLTWIRATMQIQSSLFELVNNSLNMNPTLLQSLAIKQMDKPVSKVKTE